MGVVDRTMLHRHMSEPRWTHAQEQEADRVCVSAERDLEAALFGAVISPVERMESAPISRDGLVDTTLPVHRVLELDGAPLAEGDPLPTGYALRTGRLFMTNEAVTTYGGLSVGWPWIAPVDVAPAYTGGVLRLRYLGGWGPEPALVEAILQKAAARMTRRHADTIVATGLTGTPANSAPVPQHWTPEELAPLARFRNLGWGSRR